MRKGSGAEMRQPLGIAIGGGLLMRQLLTLYATPVVYLCLERCEARLRKWPWRTFRSDRAASLKEGTPQ